MFSCHLSRISERLCEYCSNRLYCVCAGMTGGLSRPQIIGLAAGIPCSLLFLLLLIGLIYLCVYCCKKKRRSTTLNPLIFLPFLLSHPESSGFHSKMVFLFHR